MEIATEVRYSGVVVGRGAPVRDRDGAGAFVVLAEPLPVGTRITLRGEGGDEEARVTQVIESSNPDTAGMRVRFGEAPAKAAPVEAAVVEVPASDSTASSAHPTESAPHPADPSTGGGKRRRRKR